MKRTDITDIFPDATKEQIDKLMGINGADVNSARGDLEALRGQLATAQSDLERLGGSGEQLQAANARITTLEGELNTMRQTESIRQLREKVAGEKAVPASLLTGETEDDLNAQADAILAFANQNGGYPYVPDGGEPSHGSKHTTRDQFAEWAKDNL